MKERTQTRLGSRGTLLFPFQARNLFCVGNVLLCHDLFRDFASQNRETHISMQKHSCLHKQCQKERVRRESGHADV